MKGVVVATLKNGLGASREGIVHELRARGASGADELAELLGVTKQCVRKHLDGVWGAGPSGRGCSPGQSGPSATAWPAGRPGATSSPRRRVLDVALALQHVE